MNGPVEWNRVDFHITHRQLRYQLETVLTLMVLAKLCGEDQPSGIGDLARHRTA